MSPAADTTAASSAAITLFTGVLIAVVLCGHAIHHFRFKYASQGSIALLLGLMLGGILFAFGKDAPPVDTSVFFHILLPPIIFQAGFSVKRKLFFHNFFTISMLGVVGTFTASLLIAGGSYVVLDVLMPQAGILRCSLALGIICASTDTVATLQVLDQRAQPVLHSLVFGEGVVNDAVAIVLLMSLQRLPAGASLSDSLQAVMGRFVYLFISSLLLGVAMGLVSSLVIRHVFRRSDTDNEVLVVALMGFLAYSLADALNLSAIFAVFFCGITMSHYTWYNLDMYGRVITRHSFRVFASLMEIIMFAFSGMDIWFSAALKSYSASKVAKTATLSLSLMVFIAAARAIFVFPLCLAANKLWRRDAASQLSRSDMGVLWWSGLARGAITLALTYHEFYGAKTDELSQTIIVAVTVAVLLSTLLFGVATGPILEHLNVTSCSSPLGMDDFDAPLLQSQTTDEQDAAFRRGGGYRGVAREDRREAGSQRVDESPLHGYADAEEDGAYESFGEGSEEGGQPQPQGWGDRLAAGLRGPSNWLHQAWHDFDRKVMQPYFGGSSYRYVPSGTELSALT